jgi:hypothetical protein
LRPVASGVPLAATDAAADGKKAEKDASEPGQEPAPAENRLLYLPETNFIFSIILLGI